ncbi:MAG: hypothetical protein IKP73_07075 [Bacteroidales bacterium]|nr:hypothetical protein [Bacteroidales bacterium]
MRVISLLDGKFESACKDLSMKISETYKPDVVIGVLTGGGYVGKELMKNFLIPQTTYTEVRVQRSSTAKKGNGFVHKVLQILPYFVLDWLRMAEMSYGSLKAKKNNPKREGNVQLSDEVDALLKKEAKQILLVDDAIDTGATLKLIKDTLSERYPLSTIKIAVITVTSNQTFIDADFCLYHDRTLIRFPWSNDVKQKK